MRKRKGPGEESEMVEDDEVGEEIENETKRLDDNPSPVKERGAAMPPPCSASGRSRAQRTRAARKNIGKESGSECTSAHLSALSTDSEVNEVIGRGERQLFKVQGALVKETLSLRGVRALNIKISL